MLFLLSSLWGCGSPDVPPEPAPAPAPTPLTARDSDAVARTFADALEGGCDASAIDRHIHRLTLVERAAARSAKPLEELDPLQLLANLGSSLCRTGVGFDSARVLRVDTTEIPHRAMIRRSGPSGFSYLELYIAKPEGEARVVDVDILAAGQRYSDILAQSWTTLAGVADSDTKDESVAITKEVDRLAKQRRFVEARAKLATLPASVRGSRVLLLRDVMLAAQVGPDAYDEAHTNFAARFPDDPALMLLSIDRFTLQQRYDDALVAIDELDRHVGGDPYLEMLRGKLDHLKGDPQAARAHFTEAQQAEPTLADTYLGLVEVGLSIGDHAAVAETLTAMQRVGKTIPVDAIRTDPRFGSFVQSAEGRAYLGTP